MKPLKSSALIFWVIAAGCSQNHPAAPTVSGEPAAVRSMPAPDASAPSIAAEAAKPIRIVQGSVVFNSTFRGGPLHGTRGFRFDMILGDGTVPAAMCNVSTDCMPGAVVILHGEFAGLDAAGPIRWRGTTYEAGEIGSFITIDGSFVAPPRA